MSPAVAVPKSARFVAMAIALAVFMVALLGLMGQSCLQPGRLDLFFVVYAAWWLMAAFLFACHILGGPPPQVAPHASSSSSLRFFDVDQPPVPNNQNSRSYINENQVAGAPSHSLAALRLGVLEDDQDSIKHGYDSHRGPEGSLDTWEMVSLVCTFLLLGGLAAVVTWGLTLWWGHTASSFDTCHWAWVLLEVIVWGHVCAAMMLCVYVFTMLVCGVVRRCHLRTRMTEVLV